MTSHLLEPIDADDAKAWATQTELGLDFGWSSIQMGHCLLLIGLRMDKEPTDAAKEASLVMTVEKLNAAGQPYTQTLWHMDTVTARVRAYVRLVGGLPTVTDIIGSVASKPAKKSKPTLVSLGAALDILSQRVEFLENSQLDISA
ncbi:hypothetical protein ACX80D_16595 [Arthrobacter sp. Sr24]